MRLKGKAYLVKKFPSDLLSDPYLKKRLSSKHKSKRDIGLYKISPAIKGHQYVVVSSVYIQIPIAKKTTHIVQETMIFLSNRKGDVEFGEEYKTFHGFLPHDQVLRDIGYELEELKLKPETEKHFGDILREL